MPLGILALLLVAALLHAGWNVLLKTSDDPLQTAGRGMVVGALVLIPAGTVGWLLAGRPPIPVEAWVLAVVSGVLEAAYFVFLSAAYRRGDLSLVYPIARGTAPVLAVAVGVIVLGERLGPAGALGVALLLGGILGLQRPWAIVRRGGDVPRHVREAAGFALLTGVTIAIYSAVDRTGARLIEAWLYAALLWTFTAAFLLAWIGLAGWWGRRSRVDGPPATGIPAAIGDPEPGAFGGGGRVARDRRSEWGRSAVGGLVTVAAYLLVLIAYRFAPLTAVAPVRESAIVLVSGWGSFRLGEAASRRDALVRIGLAAVIVGGAFLLAAEG
jgi:multidrug transporter EmrE-like cation transporter